MVDVKKQTKTKQTNAQSRIYILAAQLAQFELFVSISIFCYLIDLLQ